MHVKGKKNIKAWKQFCLKNPALLLWSIWQDGNIKTDFLFLFFNNWKSLKQRGGNVRFMESYHRSHRGKQTAGFKTWDRKFLKSQYMLAERERKGKKQNKQTTKKQSRKKSRMKFNFHDFCSGTAPPVD